MNYICRTESPVGEITIIGSEKNITGLWFEGQDYSADEIKCLEEKELEIFTRTKEWLTSYFEGIEPDFSLPLELAGTEFQRMVWDILLEIPYGKLTTYGDIAKQITERRGGKPMYARAVGMAVGSNPVSIVVPCHRVVGAGGNLTGYGGGLDKKIQLLELEGVDMSKLHMPKPQKNNKNTILTVDKKKTKM